MSWIRSSRGVWIGVLAVILLVAVGTAGAVTVVGDDPGPVQVDSTIEYSAAVEEPFRNAPSEWTLQASTNLENATWVVSVSSQGDPVATRDFGGENFTLDLSEATNPTPTLVNITLTGDVPPISSYSYADRSTESVSVMTIARVSGGNANVLGEVTAPRYTQESREARQAIDAAIEAVGGRNDKIEQAISAYNTGNFGNAVSLAEEAESGAQSGQLILFLVIGVVVLAVLAGAVYYWRQRQQCGYKLQ
ncbi:MAG: hypothetical protein ABEH64_08640 [Salinirussus sp.]